MKNINTYISNKIRKTQNITEKLKISKSKSNQSVTQHTLFPETYEELKKMIADEMLKNGNECYLNHIDVSKITTMEDLFYHSEFNGDISEWDVSNVKIMARMFCDCQFDGDISKWNVSNVVSMKRMFSASKFNGDISDWNTSKVITMEGMFYWCKFDGDI